MGTYDGLPKGLNRGTLLPVLAALLLLSAMFGATLHKVAPGPPLTPHAWNVDRCVQMVEAEGGGEQCERPAAHAGQS